MNNFLKLVNIQKSFGAVPVVQPLNLSIAQGKMVTLLGPSGCGKTTILRLIAGLEQPDTGEIWLAGQNITHQPPQMRNIGIVFQSYALFPHLNVAENIGFGLKMQGESQAERTRQIAEALALVDLSGLQTRRIDQLSGGQQQRVALARALILKPKVLLFDEPLSNLDTNLRRSMRDNIRRLQQQLNITAIYVTHDQSEAFAVSDEVIVMNQGEIVQQGSAEQLYSQPNSLFLANFMGESSQFHARLQQNQLIIGDYRCPFTRALPDGDYWLGIRPEAVRLKSHGSEAECVQIQHSTFMGAYWEISALWQGKPLLMRVNPADFDRQQRDYFISLLPSAMFLLPR